MDGADRDSAHQLRQAHSGANFNLGNTAAQLNQFVSLGTWHNPDLAARWATLPLAPTDRMPIDARAREQNANPIQITVVTRTLADPNAAASALGGQDGDFLGPLVVRSAARALNVVHQAED